MRIACLAGTKIVLRSCVCLCVCSFVIFTCAKLCHCIAIYAIIAMSTVEVCRLSRPRYVKLAQFCVCLSGQKVVGSDNNSVLASSDS